MSASGLTQRRRGAGNSEANSPQDQTMMPTSPLDRGSSGDSLNGEFQADEDGFSEQELQNRKVKLTLMEEVILLGIKDQQGYLSFLNDNISYVLRGCILMELAMRKRIRTFKEPAGRHHRKPFTDRLVEVIDDTPTGEMLLDETLKLMKMDQTQRSANSVPVPGTGKVAPKYSVADWIDLLSGETWNLMKISYQLKQVRERLAKGLVDKGVLRTAKKNFLVFEMATHPVADASIKAEVINRVVDSLLGKGPSPTRRTIALCCAAYAANVVENALSAVSHTAGLNLSYAQKDSCFAKCEEMLAEWSGSQLSDQEMSRAVTAREKIGWTDIMSGAVGVFMKMDSML